MIVNNIYGPPGTGKTFRLMQLLEKELHTYQPEEIAYCSFTQEGAYQGRDRAIEKFNLSGSRFPYFRTLHSIAFRSLKLNRSDVMGKKDYLNFSRQLGMHFTGYYTEDLKNNDDKFLFFDELYRNNPRYAATLLEDMDIEKLRFVRHNYTRFKAHLNKIDYTDMIQRYVRDNKSLPVKVAFIDEAQDLTTLQWSMIWIAFREVEKIYIAGDDDQAIYQWSGADVDYFLKLEGNNEILRHSYRVPNNLLHVPRSITEQLSNRVVKQYDGLEHEGKLEYLNTFKEAPVDNGDDWLILSRNNYFLTDVESWLRSKGLVYRKKGELSISKQKVEAINLFERVRKSSMMDDETELKLRLHLNDRYDLRLPWYDNFKMSDIDKAYYRDVIANKSDLNSCRIKVGTIHSAKGDEAENVLLLTDITKQVKVNMDRNPDAEHRCFYVGVTRARRNLYIVNPSSKFSYTIY